MNSYNVITLFPNLIEEWKNTGIIHQALKNNLVDITSTNLRDFGIGTYKQVDDAPYGGGPKKGGLMGYIGGVGIGGVSQRQSRKFCGPNSCNNRDMNTMFGLKCVGNYSNPSQVKARMAQRGMF